MEYNPLSLLF